MTIQSNLHQMGVLEGIRDHLEGISGGTHKSRIGIASLVSHESITYLGTRKITPRAIVRNSLKMITYLFFYQIDEGKNISALHSKKR